jgi:hypothetical protein
MNRPHIIDGLPNPGTKSGLTERFEYKLEIIPPNSVIQCRRADIVEKDGVEIARGYFRTTYVPGDDVSAACPEVQKVAAALWPAPIDPEFAVDPGAEAGTMDETTVE